MGPAHCGKIIQFNLGATQSTQMQVYQPNNGDIVKS